MEFLIITMSLIFLSLFGLSFLAIGRMLAQIKQKTIVISTRQLEDRLNAKTLHNNQNYTRDELLSIFRKYDFTNKYISVDVLLKFIEGLQAESNYRKMQHIRLNPASTFRSREYFDGQKEAFEMVAAYIKPQ